MPEDVDKLKNVHKLLVSVKAQVPADYEKFKSQLNDETLKNVHGLLVKINAQVPKDYNSFSTQLGYNFTPKTTNAQSTKIEYKTPTKVAPGVTVDTTKPMQGFKPGVSGYESQTLQPTIPVVVPKASPVVKPNTPVNKTITSNLSPEAQQRYDAAVAAKAKEDKNIVIKPAEDYSKYNSGWYDKPKDEREDWWAKRVPDTISYMPKKGIIDPHPSLEPLVFATAEQESGHRPDVTHMKLKKGENKGDSAKGLFGIMPKSARNWSKEILGEKKSELTKDEQIYIANVKLNEYLKIVDTFTDDEDEKVMLARVMWYGNNGKKWPKSIDEIDTRPAPGNMPSPLKDAKRFLENYKKAKSLLVQN